MTLAAILGAIGTGLVLIGVMAEIGSDGRLHRALAVACTGVVLFILALVIKVATGESAVEVIVFFGLLLLALGTFLLARRAR